MISQTTVNFRQAFQALPSPVQDKARKVYRLWKQDPWNPGLHFKRIHTFKPIYSIRIGLGWRAVGIKTGETVVWFWIGSHADYDQMLRQL